MSNYGNFKRGTPTRNPRSSADGVNDRPSSPRERLRISESSNKVKSTRERRFNRSTIALYVSFSIIVLTFIAFFIIMLSR